MGTNLTFSGDSPSYDTSTPKFGSAALICASGRQNIGGALPTSSTITIAMWVKTSSTPLGSAYFQAGSANGTSVQSASILTDGTASNLYYNTSSGGQMVSGPATGLNDGSWHFISVALTPSGARYYMDGVQVGTNSAAYVPPSAGTSFVNIGHQGSFGSYFTGEVDGVEVWTIDKYTGSSYSVPTAQRNGTESGLAYLYNMDGNGDDSTASGGAAVTIARSDAAIFYSPYTWQDDGTSRIANAAGAYLKVNFTGTSISVTLTGLTGLGAYPVLRAYIDDLKAVDIQLTSGQTTATLATGLASGTHSLRLVVKALSFETGQWSLANSVKVTGFTLDSGASASASTLRSKRAIVYGDSYTAGLQVTRSASYPARDDATLTEWPLIMEALGAEWGQIGYSGTGYEQTYNSVPTFPNHYSLYSSGSSRLVSGVLSPAPDYVAVMQGTNGTTTQADVAGMIANLRTIAPAAKIFQIVPANGFARTVITAAVNAAVAAGDGNLFLIDAGSGAYQTGVTNLGSETEESYDGLHPLALTNARLAAEHTRQINNALQPRRFNLILV